MKARKKIHVKHRAKAPCNHFWLRSIIEDPPVDRCHCGDWRWAENQNKAQNKLDKDMTSL